MSYVLPSRLLDRIRAVTPHHFPAILQGFSANRFGSFRINTLKATAEEVCNELFQKHISVLPFLAMDNVFLFEQSQDYAIKGTDAFYHGKIYLQSVASLLPVLALEPKRGEFILDMCAAP